MYAQTVVTPANLAASGWLLGDGSSGTSRATISGAQPYNGNGSLQFTVNASNQQPLAFYNFASPVAFSSLTSFSLGYSLFTPTTATPAASPTIRLLLSGLTNSGQSGRSDGSFGWYLNGAAGAWDTRSFTMNSGDFFFRVGGVGQEDASCKNPASSFDDRRQTIGLFKTACTGANGTVNLSTASIVGVEVDWGTFVAPPGATVYADAINFSVGTYNGNYNFETSASSVVPEPASMALMAFGMVAVGIVSRKRKQKA